MEHQNAAKDARLHRMGTEKMLPLIISFSLPSIVSMTAQALYNITDTIFVGRLGTEAIAGLTLIMPLQMLVLGFGLLIGIGASSFISRSLGSKNYQQANHIFSSSIFLGLVISIFITLVGVFQLKPLLEFIGRESRAIPQAYEYGFTLIFAIPIMMFNMILSQCARAEGNPRIAMNSQLTGAGLNIILDPIFIFYFKMGIRGAAIATVIASMFALLIIVRYFTSARCHLKFRLSLILPSKEILVEISKSGFPSFARHFAASGVAILTNSLLAAYGAFALAIMGINNRFIMIFFMPMIGTSMGFMPIAGYNYGAKNLARVKEAFWKATLFVTAICTAGWLLVQLFPELCLKIFIDDPEVIAQGKSSLRMINALLPLVGFQIIGGSIYQAIGNGLAGFILSIARQVLAFLPLVILFHHFWGIEGIFLSFPIADLVAFTITAVWLRYTFRWFDDEIPAIAKLN